METNNAGSGTINGISMDLPAIGKAARNKWEGKFDEIFHECRNLWTEKVSCDQEQRDNVKTMLDRAFAIIPKDCNISNERDAGRYFQLFCLGLGLDPSVWCEGALVELWAGETFLFGFTFGKSSYDAFQAFEDRYLEKYLNKRKIHVFGVNYNPKTRKIDKPLSATYDGIPYNKPDPQPTYCPSMFKHEWEWECERTSDVWRNIKSYRRRDSECEEIEEEGRRSEEERKREEAERKKKEAEKEAECRREEEKEHKKQEDEACKERERRERFRRGAGSLLDEQGELSALRKFIINVVMVLIGFLLMKSCSR